MPGRAAGVFDRQRRGNRSFLALVGAVVGRAGRVCPPTQDERAPDALHP